MIKRRTYLGDGRLQGGHRLTQRLVGHGVFPSLSELNAVISTSVRQSRCIHERGIATVSSHARASNSVTLSVGSPIVAGAQSAK